MSDVSGVATDAIVAELAISACIDAIKAHPGERRFEFQLSRAFHKAGRQAEEITELKTAAGMGSIPAMNNLGVMYRIGQGMAKDEPAAVRLFRKAADAGFALAMTNLGQMYQQGLGVAHDDVEAARLFRGAADGGNSIAMVNIGYYYEKGLGVAVDAQEAARWYRKAADAGNSVGMTNLAIMTELGLGIAKSEAEAAALYRKAADAGNAVAMFKLALMYEHGSGGLLKDNALAMQFLQQAAKAGNQDAATKLASNKDTSDNLAARPKEVPPAQLEQKNVREERAPDKSPSPANQPSPSAVQSTLAMQLEVLSDDTRRRFQIAQSVNRGIVVVRVDPTIKGIRSGDVIQDINQEPVNSLDEVAQRENAAKSLGRNSLLLLVTDSQGRPRFVALPIDQAPASELTPVIAVETKKSNDNTRPQAAPQEDRHVQRPVSDAAATEGGMPPYNLRGLNKIVTVGHIASSESMCRIFGHKIFNNSFSDLTRQKISLPVPVFVVERDVDRSGLMVGWLNGRFRGLWNPVDEEVINENISDCLKKIWSIDNDKYRVISMFLGILKNDNSACFEQKYKSTVKIRDDGQKYELKTPIGQPKCIELPGNPTDRAYYFSIMLSLEEAHPVLTTILNDAYSDRQPEIDALRNDEVARQNALNDRKVAQIKEAEASEANREFMSPIIIWLFLYMVACGIFVWSMVRPQMLHWYQSQIWVYSAPNNIGGLIGLIQKRVVLRLSFELIIFVVSCVVGGLGGWYFKLRRKRIEAQQAQ